MSGKIGDLSPEQEKKLKQFRNALRDVLRPHHDDIYLLRWLRARKFDLNAAETMIRNSLQWRKTIGVDTFKESDFPEVLRKYIPAAIIGHDKEGCPVWLIFHGQLDLRGLLRSVKPSDIVRYAAYLIEKDEADTKKQREKLGKPIEFSVYIHDLENLSWAQYGTRESLQVIIEVLKLFDLNFPENFKKAYVINTPRFMPYLFAAISPFLSSETVNKFCFYPRGTWKEVLLENIDPSELPVHYGGTKVDDEGDPKCSSIVGRGGKVPRSYYMNSRKIKNSKTVVIKKGLTFSVEVIVKEPGSTMNWKFRSEDYDIAFGVFRVEADIGDDNKSCTSSTKEEVTIIPLQRVDCHLEIEDGSILCDIPGTYIVKFDNSYSWLNAKKILYNIEVVSPGPMTMTVAQAEPWQHCIKDDKKTIIQGHQ